jgi:hypothetical protein
MREGMIHGLDCKLVSEDGRPLIVEWRAEDNTVRIRTATDEAPEASSAPAKKAS